LYTCATCLVLIRSKRCFELATLLRLANLRVTSTAVSKYERNRRTDIDVRII
jgi:hypothetical protein